MEFLAVEVAGADSPGLRMLRSMPGLVVDSFLLARGSGEPASFRTLCHVTGGTALQREAFVDLLRRVAPGLALVPGPSDMVRASFAMPEAALSPEVRAVAEFAAQHDLRLVWTRVEDAIVYIRMMLPEGSPDLAEALRAHLRAAGVVAQVATEAESASVVAADLQAVALELASLRSRGRAPTEGF